MSDDPGATGVTAAHFSDRLLDGAGETVTIADGKPLVTGYTFAAAQPVRGLAIVARVTTPSTLRKSEYFNGNRMRIQYRDGAGAWHNITDTDDAGYFAGLGGLGYREWVYDSSTGTDGEMYENYADFPGYALGAEYYVNDVYGDRYRIVYLAFPGLNRDVDGIRIVHDAGLSELDIAELMVFEENPVAHLDIYGPEKDDLFESPAVRLRQRDGARRGGRERCDIPGWYGRRPGRHRADR